MPVTKDGRTTVGQGAPRCSARLTSNRSQHERRLGKQCYRQGRFVGPDGANYCRQHFRIKLEQEHGWLR
jgi:hypothetical protein